MNRSAKVLLLAAGSAILLVFAICHGPTDLLGFGKLAELLRRGSATPELERASLVLWHLRLPRVLLAACAGANLALGGLLLQAILRNPLAEPYLLGLSSGGALGAVLAIAAGATSVLWPALAGSAAAAALVVLVCRGRVAPDNSSLLLAGIAIGALAQAATTGVILRFDPAALRGILFWLMGSFAGRGWGEVALLAPAVVLGLGLSAVWHRPLDLLALGADSAHHLGVRVRTVQIWGLLAAAALAAVTVAACGTIGFIGLMAPHIARRAIGAPHALAAPACALVGAALAVGSDLAARTLLRGTELPVGVITGVLGCIFFLALLPRND